VDQENRYHPGGQVKAPVLKFECGRPRLSRAVLKSGGLSSFSGSRNVLCPAPYQPLLSRPVANPVARFTSVPDIPAGSSPRLRPRTLGQARVTHSGGGGADAISSPWPSRITHVEVPERSNGAVSKCAWRRPGLSRSIPGSEVLCGFQPCCRRVFSRLILPCARPFGANSGAKPARSPPRRRGLGYWPGRSKRGRPRDPRAFRSISRLSGH
jgi:hypothetical protein